MSVVDLTDEKLKIDFGKDAAACPLFLSGLKGGRSLNVEGFTPAYIRAGHVVIRETSTGDYKPMPVSGNAYSSLPSGHEYVGVVYRSIPASMPLASVMTRGEVNSVAAPYPMDTILAAFKTACPHIAVVSTEDE